MMSLVVSLTRFWNPFSLREKPVLSAAVEGPVLSFVEGPVLSEVEGPVLSEVEGAGMRGSKSWVYFPSL
jgi:hypothetical protein